jgi:hypothetical protein
MTAALISTCDTTTTTPTTMTWDAHIGHGPFERRLQTAVAAASAAQGSCSLLLIEAAESTATLERVLAATGLEAFSVGSDGFAVVLPRSGVNAAAAVARALAVAQSVSVGVAATGDGVDSAAALFGSAHVAMLQADAVPGRVVVFGTPAASVPAGRELGQARLLAALGVLERAHEPRRPSARRRLRAVLGPAAETVAAAVAR